MGYFFGLSNKIFARISQIAPSYTAHFISLVLSTLITFRKSCPYVVISIPISIGEYIIVFQCHFCFIIWPPVLLLHLT